MRMVETKYGNDTVHTYGIAIFKERRSGNHYIKVEFEKGTQHRTTRTWREESEVNVAVHNIIKWCDQNEFPWRDKDGANQWQKITASIDI